MNTIEYKIMNITEMCHVWLPRTTFSTEEWHSFHSMWFWWARNHCNSWHPTPNLSPPQKWAGGPGWTLVCQPFTTVIGQGQEQDPVQMFPLVHKCMLKHRSYFSTGVPMLGGVHGGLLVVICSIIIERVSTKWHTGNQSQETKRKTGPQ